MGRAALDRSRAQPEEDPPVDAEPLQIGMAGRPVLAVIIQPLRDAEWRERGRIEGDRTIQVADGKEYMVEQGTPPV